MMEEKTLKKTVSILLAVLMLTFALTGCGSSQNSPEGVVKKFVDSINSGNLNGVIECMTPDVQETMKALMGLYDSADLAELMGFDSGSKFSLTVNGVQIDGDRALVNATVVSGEESDTSDVPCVKIDGKWYLDMG
jgi:uncharacterized lipoprotein YehR (DUF1307 family)